MAWEIGTLRIEEFNFWKGQKLPLEDFVSEYRKLYSATKALFAKFEPCEIYDDTCKRGRRGDDSSNSFCCGGCEFQAEDGCTTDSIWCALWTCFAIKTDEAFWTERRALTLASNELVHGHGGRYGLDVYVQNFYGPDVYEQWKAKEIVNETEREEEVGTTSHSGREGAASRP